MPHFLPDTDVLIVAECWDAEADAEAVIRRAIEAAASMVENDVADAELAVMLTDDAGIRTLNNNWRKIDKPTNVLSFPSSQGAPMLGDIVVAYETLARESRDEGKEFTHHLSHLAVHGFLHLMGYDHQTDSDAETMEELERAVLARLRIPDPYLVRG